MLTVVNTDICRAPLTFAVPVSSGARRLACQLPTAAHLSSTASSATGGAVSLGYVPNALVPRNHSSNQ